MARLARLAEVSAQAGELQRAMRQNLWGMWPHFVLFGGVSMLAGALGLLVAPVVAGLPAPLLRGLAWAYPAMASVSAAFAARGSRAKAAGLWAGLGASAVVLWALWTWRPELP